MAQDGAVRLRVAHLNGCGETPFAVDPDAAARAALATEFDLSDLPRATLRGTVSPAPAGAWRLEGRLVATVIQPCGVTLKPVTTRIDEPVTRVFSPHAADPEGDEVEMPDDEIEPLGTFIDLSAVLAEALALAIPPYPRADGAEAALPELEAEPDTRKPFAGLADLMRGKGEG